MKKIRTIVILFISLLLFNCSEDKIDFIENGIITGKVVQANNFEPIENVKVTISPSNNTAFTNTEGKFEFLEISVGDYSVQAEKDTFITGFEPITVTANGSVNVIIELEKSDALNRPPTSVNLLNPTNNSTNLGAEVQLSWSEAVDPDDDDITYTLEVRNDADNHIISIENITETTYLISDLEFGVKYFWQIIADDGINPAVLSTTFAFETKLFPSNRFLYVREEFGNNIIYSSNELNEDITITNISENCWRPRKNQITQRIAFLKTYNSETHIFTMNPDGTDERQVTSTVHPAGFKQSELDFSWSSSGNKIIYPSFDKLYLINQDGSGNQLIYQTTDNNFITECDWSNDGNIIAIKTNNSNGYNVKIYTIDMSGNILTTILSDVNGAAGGINISVNNEKLLYAYDISAFENSSYRQLDSHLFIFDFITGTTTDYSTFKINGTNDFDPRFSPNESQIMMVNTSNDGISEKKIFTVDLVDDQIRTLLFNNAIMPDWE